MFWGNYTVSTVITQSLGGLDLQNACEDVHPFSA